MITMSKLSFWQLGYCFDHFISFFNFRVFHCPTSNRRQCAQCSIHTYIESLIPILFLLTQFRFRYLERPSQFGGSRCYESLWEKLACPTATTQCMVPDYCGDSFTCSGSGQSHWQPSVVKNNSGEKTTLRFELLWLFQQGDASASPFAVTESQIVKITRMKTTVITSIREMTNAPP